MALPQPAPGVRIPVRRQQTYRIEATPGPPPAVVTDFSAPPVVPKPVAPTVIVADPPEEENSSDCALVRLIEREFYLKETEAPIQLVDHQKRILNFLFTPDDDGRFPFSTIVYSCPKKSGKTEIAAAICYAFARLYGGDCISVANDEEQASSRMFNRVLEMLKLMRRKNRRMYTEVLSSECHDKVQKAGQILFAQEQQVNKGPHVLRYIANDYAGEAGAINALTVFDELWAISTERGVRLWTELQPIPTLKVSMRLVTTYAGFYGESELLYSIYEQVVNPDPQTDQPRGTRVPGLEDLPCYQDGATFVYWDHEARMPWHTHEFLEKARQDPSMKGRESEYRRLWQNRWSTGREAFLDIGELDRLFDVGRKMGLTNHLAA